MTSAFGNVIPMQKKAESEVGEREGGAQTYLDMTQLSTYEELRESNKLRADLNRLMKLTQESSQFTLRTHLIRNEKNGVEDGGGGGGGGGGTEEEEERELELLR